MWEGSVRINSVSGAFELIADTDAVVAEVGQLGLVETGGFDLTLAQGRISVLGLSKSVTKMVRAV